MTSWYQVQDSESSTEKVGGGNKKVQEAVDSRSAAQEVFYATRALCTTVLRSGVGHIDMTSGKS